MIRIVICLLLLNSACATSAIAEELRITKYHFYNERKPTTISELITTPESKQVLTGVAAYFGVPPELSGLILAVPQVKDNTREEGEIAIPLDSGYKFCDLKYEEISRNPQAGHMRARLRVTGNERSVNIPYWLKKGAIGGGRAWFDINLSVLSVRDDVYQKYQCKVPGTVYADYYPDNCC